MRGLISNNCILPCYSLITRRDRRAWEVLEVASQYLEWDYLGADIHRRRLEYVWQRIAGRTHIPEGKLCDEMSKLLAEARATIGVFLPAVINKPKRRAG